MPLRLSTMLSTPLRRLALAVLLAFGVDQLSKVFVLKALDLATVHTVPVWPPYLNFLMAWNAGINFGFLSGYDARSLLAGFAIVVSAGMAFWVRDKAGWLLPLATGAVVGGALGNAADRLIYGAVVDFINMGCCGIVNPYSFNLADVWIAAGMVAIVMGQNSRP